MANVTDVTNIVTKIYIPCARMALWLLIVRDRVCVCVCV